ncbi:ash family protein [Escherichia coli]|nr:Ash domain protein [Escherichia coli]MDE3901640.1 ash family protein [Escherichia coli]
MMMPALQKLPFSGLPFSGICGYSFSAAAKSAAGRGNPSNSQATYDAPCVFFVSQSTPQSARLWCGVWSVVQMAFRASCPRPLIMPQSQW